MNSSLFELKDPQIKNVSWEEINSSWEGIFGYSQNLKPGVTKREVKGSLYDLEKMRSTKSFDEILLNLWEIKFYKWLEDLDKMKTNNEQMVRNNYNLIVFLFTF